MDSGVFHTILSTVEAVTTLICACDNFGLVNKLEHISDRSSQVPLRLHVKQVTQHDNLSVDRVLIKAVIENV